MFENSLEEKMPVLISAVLVVGGVGYFLVHIQ
jgi:hypothetical protein